MIKIAPRYEVLYNDLIKHKIGEYLVSRDFKSFMTSKGYYEEWDTVKNRMGEGRHVFSLDVDMGQTDATRSLVQYLNSLDREAIQVKVSEIIHHFILFKKNREDFSDLIDSLNLSKLDSKYISFIAKAVKINSSKTNGLGINFEKIATKVNTSAMTKKPSPEEIFIVHGHNEEILSKVKLLLREQNLRAIVLNEQANEGQTIIEKFEKHSEVNFAIVLITGDDWGNKINMQKKKKRARQNVILELGYFIGKLGRKKVLILNESDVEWPSDLAGVVYVPLDVAGAWQMRMIKELRNAGFEVDANAIL